MPVGGPLTMAAPAKINLYLRVQRRRADGYHDLDSWMQKIALFDRLVISLRPAPGITLEIDDERLPADATNLVWRAAAAFFEACRLPGKIGEVGADIFLEKNIPLAAGLGGGSSDAAATLLGLNRLCGFPLSTAALAELGLSLGADVPFFLFPAPAALAGGVGEILRPAPVPQGYSLVLVNPGFAVSTKEVFARLSLTEERKKTKKPSPVVAAGGCDVSGLVNLVNDLEAVAVAMYPEISRIKDRLLAFGATAALMSGSGPTVFALFPAREFSGSLAGIKEYLRQEFGSLVFVTSMLTGA